MAKLTAAQTRSIETVLYHLDRANKFIQDESTIIARRKSMKTYDLPKRLANQAMREADKMLRDQHALGQFDDGDPNHPMYNAGINYATGLPVSIFGYETIEFLDKQYK